MAAPQQHYGRRVRTYREQKDVLNTLTDSELITRYRLDRAGIVYVTDLVRRDLESPTERNHALTAELKVVITLRYLATGKMQQCSSDDLGPSQPTISRVISQALDALTQPRIIAQFINFPTTQREIARRQADFLNIAGFPGVVGAIDGTHIRIIAPTENEHEFVNRKNFHSINTQVVFDAQYNILDIVAKWPGSTHDARILDQCGIKRMFDRNTPETSCHML